MCVCIMHERDGEKLVLITYPCTQAIMGCDANACSGLVLHNQTEHVRVRV